MRTLLILFLVAGCGDSSDSSDASADLQCGAPAALPECVPGQYLFEIVTDPPPGYCIDPRCWPNALPNPGEHCDYPGLACEYFAMTIGCDCDGIARCMPDPYNPGSHCSTDGGL